MATGDYCSLEQMREYISIVGLVPDQTSDTVLKDIITAVSREIDFYTGTRFYDPGSDDTRYYTAKSATQVWIDPTTSVTSVATDDDLTRNYSTSWTASTHYELWPYNLDPHRGLPYTRIDRAPLAEYSFPTSARAVKVVARFCYNAAATPQATVADIREVCKLKTLRLLKRKDAPFGVLGPVETGQVQVIPGFDPDELRILNNYKINYT